MIPGLPSSSKPTGCQLWELLPNDLLKRFVKFFSFMKNSSSIVYLAEGGCIDGCHAVFRTEIDVVKVKCVSGDADALRHLVIFLQPKKGCRRRVRPKCRPAYAR